MTNKIEYHRALGEALVGSENPRDVEKGIKHLRLVEGAEIEKGLSPRTTRSKKNRARLVRRLKQRRGYRKPVKGGTGKQTRSRRSKFNR